MAQERALPLYLFPFIFPLLVFFLVFCVCLWIVFCFRCSLESGFFTQQARWPTASVLRSVLRSFHIVFCCFLNVIAPVQRAFSITVGMMWGTDGYSGVRLIGSRKQGQFIDVVADPYSNHVPAVGPRTPLHECAHTRKQTSCCLAMNELW